jgi:hypothetical protein
MVVAGISAEIHGAIVGGLLGGFGVLLGILGESWATRLHDRRVAVETAAAELVILLPHVVGPISVLWGTEEVDTSYGSEWARRRDDVQHLIFVIIQNARWPMRQRQAVHDAAEETAARLATYTLLWFTDRSRITAQESFDMYEASPGGVLSRARNLDARINELEADARRMRGLPAK